MCGSCRMKNDGFQLLLADYPALHLLRDAHTYQTGQVVPWQRGSCERRCPWTGPAAFTPPPGRGGGAMPIRFHMALAPCPPPGNAHSVPARGGRLTGAQPVVVQGPPHRRRLPAGPSCPRATAQRWARCQWVSTRPAPATVPGRHGGQGDAAGSS